MIWTDYLARRDTRSARCGSGDRALLAAALAPWGPFTREEGWLDRIAALEVPAGSGATRLVAWALGPAPADPGLGDASEAELDRWVLGRPTTLDPDASQRRVAALYLLARLGEELDQRERVAWTTARFPAHPLDGASRDLWRQMLSNEVRLDTGRRLRKLHGGAIRRSFAAVGADLHLPPSVISAHADSAVDALEYLPYGAHLDVAARIVEAAGEPMASLAAVLTPETAATAGACVTGRGAWSATSVALLGESAVLADVLPRVLATGIDLHVTLRLIEHLGVEVPAGTSGGLPGWLIVRQNRGKARGRLRAVVGMSPATLSAHLLPLQGLHARSEAAFARYAFDWAWREARAGFSFDMDRMRSPACVVPPPGAPPLAPIPSASEPAVGTTLLSLVARGCWEDLGKWLDGAPSRDLSDAFYRCLKDAPDEVSDPQLPGARARTYHRLRDHLEGALDTYRPMLDCVATRIAVLHEGRRLKDELHAALLPDWVAAATPLPQHYLGAIVRNFQIFIGARASGAEGAEA